MGRAVVPLKPSDELQKNPLPTIFAGKQVLHAQQVEKKFCNSSIKFDLFARLAGKKEVAKICGFFVKFIFGLFIYLFVHCRHPMQ